MAQQTTPQRKRKKNPILRGIKKAGRLYLGNVRYGDTSFLFFVYVMILLGTGLVMMSSASYAWAFSQTGDGLFYAKAQAKNIAIGLVAMIFFTGFDYHNFKKMRFRKRKNSVPTAIMFYLLGLILLVLVFFIGVDEGGSMGAKRWIIIAGVNFQPSEVAKFTLIIFLAYMIELHHDKMKNFFNGIVVNMLFIGIYAVLIYKEPHVSGTILICIIGVSMIFCGDSSLKQIFSIAGVVAVIGGIVIYTQAQDPDSYLSIRFKSWQDPFADVLNDTWQTSNSLIAIGSGGLFGLGFGNSRQKYLYLPESQSDFVFSIVCEELGFVGAFAIILVFVLLIIEGYSIAARCQDKFGCLVAVGITTQIAIQAIFNFCVVSNLVPNTGISLPFFSYGGTAIVMQLMEMGIMLNISRKRYYPEEKNPDENPSQNGNTSDKLIA
ncbi:MAG: putative peptidoglycan glycosyltransferase FtsW [Ruminococcus sp.]|nr:putative peptidoglycan glycosyltransferase FtsW [Oscillospiraceae bacterium]MDY4412913.1 putative peptidoglycan glycosyltransferase FtsW [Ruminococcus sp.]